MFTFRTVNGGLIAELDVRQRQLPFAVSKAINEIGKDAQTEVRAGFQRDVIYHAERLSYELNRIKISKFAASKSLSLVLEIDPHAMNLVRLAGGIDHLAWYPFNGKPYQWVPNSEVFKNRIILASDPLNPKNLKFTQRVSRLGPGHAGEWGGQERTFVLPQPSNSPGVPQVWQRVGSGATGSRRSRSRGNVKKAKSDSYRNTRLLYVLVSKQKTKLKLQFFEPIGKTINDNWEQAFKNALEYTVQPKGAA